MKIQLTENDIRMMVKETVKRLLSETGMRYDGEFIIDEALADLSENTPGLYDAIAQTGHEDADKDQCISDFIEDDFVPLFASMCPLVKLDKYNQYIIPINLTGSYTVYQTDFRTHPTEYDDKFNNEDEEIKNEVWKTVEEISQRGKAYEIVAHILYDKLEDYVDDIYANETWEDEEPDYPEYDKDEEF